MEKIDFLSSGSSDDSKLLLACANGIPYAIRLCTNCCSTTATSYINLATGVSSNTPPSGLSIGECADITCPPIYETESFVAAAGQTSFNLSHSPYKDVDFTRNGATLIDSVAVVNGNSVTYVPSENNNINLLAGDDITISYLYLDPTCTEYSINSVICFDFVEGGVTTNIKVVSINNAITYYENGVKISDATRITEVEQLVVNANADNVVCCPDCGGGTTADGSETKINAGTNITISGSGTTASPYIINATAADGSETKITGCAGTTITGTGTTADPYVICATAADGSETKVVAGTGTTVTGTGTTADPYIISSTGGVLENVYFSTTDPNTAGTTFSPNTPQDLNKLYVSDVDGSTWIWNGTAYVSKTDNLKWQAIGNFAQLSKSGQGAVGSNTLVTWESTVNSYGSLVVPQLATETILLKAGYIYEVDVALQATFANSGSWVNYAIFSGSTAASQTTQVGTPGKIRPNTETFGPGMYDANAKGYVRALTDTYISVKTTNGNATALNAYEGATYFTAKVIGVL